MITTDTNKKEFEEFYKVREALAEKIKESRGVIDEIIQLEKEAEEIEMPAICFKSPSHEACAAWMRSSMSWEAIAMTTVDNRLLFSDEIKDALIIETKAWDKTITDLRYKAVELHALVETQKHMKQQ